VGTGRLATGIAALDTLLGGGVEVDAVTELFGEAGSGKTLLCLELAVRVARSDRWVLYIDTEGVSVDRLEAMAGAELPKLLERILLATPKGLAEQDRAVATATALARSGERPVGLIVVDSATFYYRLTLAENAEDEGRQSLAEELAQLVATALGSEVPVVVTNQVWRNPRTGTLEPLGGSYVNHAAKAILRLERLDGARRRAVLEKHRSQPEGSCEFTITPTGLR